MRLAVYGGSFDPIHVGHLAMAKAALAAKACDKVMFVPARQQPLKLGQPTTPGNLRLQMIALALAAEPNCSVSRLELDRPGPSYTLDTLRAVQASHPDSEVAFLCGMDALAGLAAWHRAEQLLAEFPFLVVIRPGSPPLATVKENLVSAGFSPEALHNVQPLRAPAVAVSSSDIRQRVREGRNLNGLVPKPVIDFIANNNLYLP